MEKAEKKDSYSHILKYMGVFGGVQTLHILIGVVRNKLVALLLGPEGMGLISLFVSTTHLVSEASNLGLSMSAVRELSEAYETGDTLRVRHTVKLVRTWSLLTALGGILLCLILSPLLSRWAFENDSHTFDIMLLSPVVGMAAIAGGETAILKATRQLRGLAVMSVYNILGMLLLTIPLYYFWRMAAIVPSLLIIALMQMLLAIAYSVRRYPLCRPFDFKRLGEGSGMVKLGVAFVAAGIFASGAEFLIRSFLNTSGDLAVVGLYNAGYMLTITYADMVFSAMGTDYYPRLSAVEGTGEKLNLVVNRQIEVSLLLVSPLLILFIVGVPILLPMLYSDKFLPVMGMMKITILAMYFRAVTLPIEYLPLAKNDAKAHLLLDAIYYVVMVVLVVAGYHWLGLAGTGIALVVTGLLNLALVVYYARYKYQYVLSRNVVVYSLVQMPLGLAAYFTALVTDGVFYWVIGLLLFFVSLAVSIQIFQSKARLWESLLNKFKKRFARK